MRGRGQGRGGTPRGHSTTRGRHSGKQQRGTRGSARQNNNKAPRTGSVAAGGARGSNSEKCACNMAARWQNCGSTVVPHKDSFRFPASESIEALRATLGTDEAQWTEANIIALLTPKHWRCKVSSQGA